MTTSGNADGPAAASTALDGGLSLRIMQHMLELALYEAYGASSMDDEYTLWKPNMLCQERPAFHVRASWSRRAEL